VRRSGWWAFGEILVVFVLAGFVAALAVDHHRQCQKCREWKQERDREHKGVLRGEETEGDGG
jgi:hypothetical protein